MVAFAVGGLDEWFLFGEEVKAVVSVLFGGEDVVVVDFLFDLFDVQLGREFKLIIVFI